MLGGRTGWTCASEQSTAQHPRAFPTNHKRLTTNNTTTNKPFRDFSFRPDRSDNYFVPSGTTAAERSDAYTIPLLCAGIAIIACCLLIPAADENRKLACEAANLRVDQEQVAKQVALNEDFLHRVADDPALLERLAQRQMKLVRQGTGVLELRNTEKAKDLSPFLLTTLPPPTVATLYRPIGGKLGTLCRNPHLQLYLLGSGLLLLAFGLLVGASGRADSQTIAVEKQEVDPQPQVAPLNLPLSF